MDSGAFSQLANHGRWTVSAPQYADSVEAIANQVGKLQWASIQDWLCSPHVLQSTGLGVKAHQKNTISSLGALRKIAPRVHWIPILQGWDAQSYIDHFAAYRAHG